MKAAHPGEEIPPGSIIHHEDENPFNNDPSNLVCITRKEHAAHHREQYERPELREHLKKIQSKSTEWHRSPEGRAWHSENGRRTWIGREPGTATCAICRKMYGTFYPERSKYCSPACSQRASRMDKRYLVPAYCPICGGTFLQHRTTKRPTTCGYRCGAALRHHSQGSGVRLPPNRGGIDYKESHARAAEEVRR